MTSPFALIRPIVPFGSNWRQLRDQPPSVLALILFPVLPLSLLPPVMLYHAGTGYPEAFGEAFAGREWGYITTIFFLAELLTFAVMSWLIHEVGNARGARISSSSACTLAAIAPIPMWLSALALLVPSLTFVITLVFAGLLLSCIIVYEGIRHLCDVQEDLISMSITYTVMAASVLAWGLLLSSIWVL